MWEGKRRGGQSPVVECDSHAIPLAGKLRICAGSISPNNSFFSTTEYSRVYCVDRWLAVQMLSRAVKTTEKLRCEKRIKN